MLPDTSPSVLLKKEDDSCEVNECAVKLGKKTAKFGPLNDDSIEKRTFSVEGMTCASCVAYIERNIGKLKGFVIVFTSFLAFNFCLLT